ncbi:MAG: hypothetical protein U0Q11_00055 [Vicinamibacterales bacterium]
MIGWSASRGDIAIGGWTLLAIVFLWQIPHFGGDRGCIATITAGQVFRCCRWWN